MGRQDRGTTVWQRRACARAALGLGLTALIWSGAPQAASDHSLGPGYRWSHLNTTGGSAIDLQSVALQYSLYSGNRIGLVLTSEVLFPLQGNQQGKGFWVPDTYDSARGLDLLVGGGVRFHPSPRWTLWTGVGPHLSGMRLAQAELRSFNSLTMGVGLVGAARWQLVSWLDLGVNVTPALDFSDLIHTTNQLSWASHLGGAVVLSLRLDRVAGHPAVRDPEAPPPVTTAPSPPIASVSPVKEAQ
jgi:hypothetical protein